MSTHLSFSCSHCFPEADAIVIGPDASSADPDGPPPGFDAAASAPPREPSSQEPEVILTDVPEVLTGPEDDHVPEGPASAGTEVLEAVYGEGPEEEVADDVPHKTFQDVLIPDTEEEVLVGDDLSEIIPDIVEVSETVAEDVSPESEEPPSEILAKEFITGSTSVVLAKPTMESPEEANFVKTTGQELTEAPPGDVIHRIQDTAVTGEEPSEITETGAESSDRPAEPPSEHPPDGKLTPDGTRTRTSTSETPALVVPVGEFEDNEIFLGVTPDPVPETEVTTQDWVPTLSEQAAGDMVTSETSGATTEDAEEETPKTSDDEPKEREDGVAQVLEGETTITGPPEEAAAKPSRTPASEQEPEEEMVEKGERSKEPKKEADGTEELLEQSAESVEEVPKKSEEKVTSAVSQQEPGIEAETGPVIPSAPLENPEVTLEKVDEHDVPEAEAEGSRPETVISQTSEETTTEADEVEGLLPGSGVEETSEPEKEVPVNLDEVPPEATPEYVVEYNNGNFPDQMEGPFGGDEGLLGNDEEENSVRSLDSSADAVSGDVTRCSCPQIGNEIDDSLVWPPKSQKDQIVEMTLKLRGETYNDALRDRSSVHYQQLARHFTRRVRGSAQDPTSNQYRKPVRRRFR